MAMISVVLTVHREGLLLAATLRSLDRAIEVAESAGYCVEVIVSLDRSDRLTRELAVSWRKEKVLFLENDFGDLGFSRNRCIAEASGDHVAVLDGDDMFSRYWLSSALSMSLTDRREIVWHPEVTVFFGEEFYIFRHIDMDFPCFEHSLLTANNPWTSLCFARRELFLRVPYPPTDLSRGIGYEDWRWNRLVIRAGAVHKVVGGCGHIVRRKAASLVLRSSMERALPVLQ